MSTLIAPPKQHVYATWSEFESAFQRYGFRKIVVETTRSPLDGRTFTVEVAEHQDLNLILAARSKTAPSDEQGRLLYPAQVGCASIFGVALPLTGHADAFDAAFQSCTSWPTADAAGRGFQMNVRTSLTAIDLLREKVELTKWRDVEYKESLTGKKRTGPLPFAPFLVMDAIQLGTLSPYSPRVRRAQRAFFAQTIVPQRVRDFALPA